MHTTSDIPGYTYATDTVPRSPVTLADFDRMKESVLFDENDVRHLQRSYEILKDQTEAILDVWYSFVGANPHLLRSFTGRKDGQPIGEYLERVRARFGQWILDTARAEYDQRWLDYQHEIGLRHHRTKKNRTDDADSTDIVPFRDLFALIFPVTFTLRPFLTAKGHSDADVESMYAAWLKSCLLQVTLWSFPYIKPGDF
ncbi:MAG: protoglobin domain-containing protein [Rhodothermales bacterium]